MATERRKYDDRLEELCGRFDRHLDDFDAFKIRVRDRAEEVIASQELNTKAVSDLTKQMSNLIGETREVIHLHQDMQGAIRIGKGVQSFVFWLLKWGAIGGGLASGILWLSEHFPVKS